MTIHRVRLFHSTAGASGFHGWLDSWLTNMVPWANPEVENTLPTEREPIGGGTNYYLTELAFEWSEDRAHILDNLDQYATSYCDWHRIGYHECSHDDDGVPCSWDEQRENGAIPGYSTDMSHDCPMLSPIEAGVLVALLVRFVGANTRPGVARAIGRAPGELRRCHRDADPYEE